ncbi:hypothetical protein ACOMHN_019544 [Nucella lapillus]
MMAALDSVSVKGQNSSSSGCAAEVLSGLDSEAPHVKRPHLDLEAAGLSDAIINNNNNNNNTENRLAVDLQSLSSPGETTSPLGSARDSPHPHSVGHLHPSVLPLSHHNGTAEGALPPSSVDPGGYPNPDLWISE